MKKSKRKLLYLLGFVFLLLNTIACFHAYKFTHFDETITQKPKDPKDLVFTEKLQALLLGVSLPRPQNSSSPNFPFSEITLNSNKKIVCWLSKIDNPKGTVILFHGYGGQKAKMIDKANEFIKLGYNTLLVDFMGSGKSEGNQTTIGFKEAEQVKTAFDYLESLGEKNIVIFGTSMGAAAILKAQNDYQLKVSKIIIECPFGTMLQTVKARFNNMHVPSFPMAYLLVFWGGTINGFNAFNHNPQNYASQVKCPVLLMYGLKDDKVSIDETNQIFNNLNGPKKLVTFANASHENYLNKYKKEWLLAVTEFLK
jgi:alpha-beta hydrolase superfamily lysophospholipase